MCVPCELIQMGSLASSINAMRNRRAFFPEETVVAVLLDLASGLAWMHRNFLAHRDIKPENAFISAEGSVKVRTCAVCRVALSSVTIRKAYGSSGSAKVRGESEGGEWFVADWRPGVQSADDRHLHVVCGHAAVHGAGGAPSASVLVRDGHLEPGLRHVRDVHAAGAVCRQHAGRSQGIYRAQPTARACMQRVSAGECG